MVCYNLIKKDFDVGGLSVKIELISEKIILSNEQSLHNYFGWPTVARLKDGRVAMVCSGYRIGHVCPFGKGVLMISDDDGESWSLPQIVIDTPLDDRDCGIVPFGESSAIVTSFNCSPDNHLEYFGWKLDEEPIVYKSAYIDLVQRTVNWKKFLGSTYRISNDNCKSFGELRFAPVTTPHGPAITPDGRMIYVGNNFNPQLDNTKKRDSISCYEILPNGEYLHLSDIEKAPGEEEFGYHEPHAIVLPDGKIIVHIRVHYDKTDLPSNLTVYQCESKDGGKSFSTPHPITEIGGGSPSHIVRDGNTLIATYSRRSKPYGIMAMFSTDGAKSWNIDNRLIDISCKPEDLGYPSSVALGDGKMLTVYYEKPEGYSGTVIKQIIWRYSDK